jgi:hypothetical protein
MLTNRDDPRTRNKLEDELSRNPPLAAVIDVVQAEREPFAVDAGVAGLEIVPLNRVKNAPNRCRMKLFRPLQERDRLCAFFYKRSNLAFSRDRFSYGAVEFRPGTLTREEIQTWLAWLSSGFDPEGRPAGLRRAFRFTVPE